MLLINMMNQFHTYDRYYYNECYKIVINAIKYNNCDSIKKIYNGNNVYIINDIVKKEKIYDYLYELWMNSSTLLMMAIYYNNIKCVKFFVEKCEASVNGTVYKNSPLFCAIFCKNSNIAQYLIKKGAKINLLDDDTPLIHACYTKNNKMVEILVKNKVDVNVKNTSGNTCLIVACEMKYFDIALYLLNNNDGIIDVNIKNNKGYTALYYCCIANNIKDRQPKKEVLM